MLRQQELAAKMADTTGRTPRRQPPSRRRQRSHGRVTTEDVRQVQQIIRFWPPDDRAWWRALLEHHPQEALKLIPLIRLGAYPSGAGAIVAPSEQEER